MGRWAEVYFTSPPEKREQAVLELLRELEGEDSPRDDAIPAPPSSVTEQASERVVGPASQIGEVQPTLVRCHSCGGENPPSHRFCGMCGTPMGEPEVAVEVRPSDLDRAEVPVADRHFAGPPQHEPAPFVRSQESQQLPVTHAADEPTPDVNDFSLFRLGRDLGDGDNDPNTGFDAWLDFGSYRIYVGIALAALIFVVAYLAWRGAQATSQTSYVPSQAPPTVTQEPTTPAPDPTRSANIQHPQPVQETVRDEARANAGLYQAPATPPSENNPLAETLSGPGAEELAAAQRYLNGVAGADRNSAEAAKWLWKAIAKHNSTATVLLADLYLKGDGVEKNCDQARVLLDSAALKGVKDAAERLRHLQAFGCE